jgi:hypothetical protein
VPVSELLGLAGEPVTISGVGDLAVGHGRFRVDNPGSAPLRAAVDSLWLEVGGTTRPLEAATVFDADRDQALDPSAFEVPPGTKTLLVGFPPVTDDAPAGQETAVGLRLSAGGATAEARSPIVFQRRIPLDR